MIKKIMSIILLLNIVRKKFYPSYLKIKKIIKFKFTHFIHSPIELDCFVFEVFLQITKLGNSEFKFLHCADIFQTNIFI